MNMTILSQSAKLNPVFINITVHTLKNYISERRWREEGCTNFIQIPARLARYD